MSSLPPWAFRVRHYEKDTTESPEKRAAVVITFKNTWIRELLFWSLVILSGGVLLLLVYWFPKIGHRLRHERTNDTFSATSLIVISESGVRSYSSCRKVKVDTSELKLALPSFAGVSKNGTSEDQVETVVFEYRCLQFLLNVWTNEFEQLSFDMKMYPSDILSSYSNGISSDRILTQRQMLYGPGCIDVPIQPLFKLIVFEIFHPFYVFQMFAVSLWLWDGYFQYATAVIIITLVSLCAELFEARRNQLKLQRMAKFVCQVSTIRRKAKPVSTTVVTSQSSSLLVPGDVIQIRRNMILPCDVLLLKGSVIVNESMLSGESVPIIKNALMNVSKDDGVGRFEIHQNSCHILFGGTEVLGLRSSTATLGLVIRTGFCTAQGQMLRLIIHPNSDRRCDFKYDTYKFLAVLAGLASLGCILSLIMTFSQGLKPSVIVVRALDTFTNAIPPALPATMTVGSTIAVTKLRRLWNVLCIAPSRVNYAGQVNTFVFDKTGTLTEEGLELEGVIVSRPIRKSSDTSNTLMTLSSLKFKSSELPTSLIGAMACCHSVTLIDSVLVGEPLEIQLLKFTGWTLSEEPLPIDGSSSGPLLSSLDQHLPCLAEVRRQLQRPTIQTRISRNSSVLLSEIDAETEFLVDDACSGLMRIVRRFEFVPALQRMSVIAWDRRQFNLLVYCKGAPEQLRRLCLPSSIPSDFTERLRRYTETGMRVLAVASKKLPLNDNWLSSINDREKTQSVLDRYSRASVECELTFLGFVVFANCLKTDSRDSIVTLLGSGCRCIMATGDNALTAAAVARDALLIDPTATSILIGDVVHPNDHNILWTPLVYSPTLSTIEESTDDESPQKVRCKKENREDLKRTNSLGSESSTDRNTEMFINLGQDRKSGDVDMNGQPFKDIRKYLSGKDPRDVVLVLTGPAFRRLEQYHKSTGAQWSGLLLGEKNKNIYRGAVERRESKKKESTWLREIEKEMNGKIGVDKDIVKIQTVKVDDGEIQEPMMLKIMVDKFDHEYCQTKISEGYDHIVKQQKVIDDKKSIDERSHEVEISLFEYVLRFCRIFARMTPDDKAVLISSLQSLPLKPLIGMCGDGANDCAALKAADVGLSLSEKETSIAAPFTSTDKSVHSVIDVLREGRGALTNSFQSFKFITLYALIQLSTTSTLYYYGGNLSDPQYLWIDLVVALPLAMTMAWTNSSSSLSRRMPMRYLVGFPVILSIIGQIFIQLIFLSIGLSILSFMDFYERFVPNTEADRFNPEDLAGYENTVVFLVSNFQYITLNLTMCLGRPWRKSSFTNWAHTLILTILLVLSSLLLICPHLGVPLLSRWLCIVETPLEFRHILASIVIINSLTTLCFERFVVIAWAVRDAEKADLPSHTIDMVLPTEVKHRVRFKKSV